VTVALIVLAAAFTAANVLVFIQAFRHDAERQRWEAERWRLITQIQHPEVIVPPPSEEAAERADPEEEQAAEETETEIEAWDEVGREVTVPAGGPVDEEAQERI
jgi:hypothetical protein